MNCLPTVITTSPTVFELSLCSNANEKIRLAIVVSFVCENEGGTSTRQNRNVFAMDLNGLKAEWFLLMDIRHANRNYTPCSDSQNGVTISSLDGGGKIDSAASLSNPAYSLMNLRRTIPVGPFRCLPMMISARPSVGIDEPSS